MPDDLAIDAPPDPALAPFRAWWAMCAASHASVRLAGEAISETAGGLLMMGAEQAGLHLAWADLVARAFYPQDQTTGDKFQPQEDQMRVSECMTSDVQIASPNDTIAEAAKAMARLDAGVLPVGENDRLVGMITDRDIAVHAVAEGKAPDTRVSEVMNAEVKYCFDDQDTEDVLRQMGELQLRRMPVLNHDKRLVGIVSLGDLAARDRAQPAGEALCDISRPGGQHSQMAH